jgi:hypothetical protein
VRSRIHIELVLGHALSVCELPSPAFSTVPVVTLQASAPAALRRAALHARRPPNDPPVLALHNFGVAGPRGGRVFTNVIRLETTAGTAKLGLVLLGSANAASTECVLHGGRDASQRRYVGARGKILFVSAVREFSQPGS